MSHPQNQSQWLEAMMQPEFYPHFMDKVELIQTHISWVFIAGEYVYKLKKPVNFGFLDFTTLEKRRFFCDKELALNKRLCPDIYLSVLALKKNGETGYKFIQAQDTGDDEVVEWALKMKRMPNQGMMQTIMADYRLCEDHVKLIVTKLLPFYQRLFEETKAISGNNQQYGSIDAVKFNTDENFAQTTSFVDSLLSRKCYDEIESYTNNFFREHQQLFSNRIASSKIVEGHGDLYSANICFEPLNQDVYVFDCIEFNERFRLGDVAADVAFLAMDLDFNGYPDLSKQFIELMSDGLSDPDMLELIRFYKCYRAYVRAKIGCFTWAADGIGAKQRDAAKADAVRYFGLANRYANPAIKPVLYVVYGLSGTGKTTLASKLAKRLEATHYNSDVVRKEKIIKTSPVEKHIEAFNQGIYQADITEKTYEALKRLASSELIAGRSVVVDATYINPKHRQDIAAIAQASDAAIKFVLCTCHEAEIKKRLEDRALKTGEASDGRWEIYCNQAKIFNATESILPDNLVVIDTGNDYEVALVNV